MNRRTFSRGFVALPFLPAGLAHASMAGESLMAMPVDVSTFTHVGKEEQPFIANTEAQLAWQDGTGYLDHMWFGGDFKNFKTLRIRVYVDGESAPSIDMELGLGVGVGFQDPAAPWGNAYAGITGLPSGIYCNYRIPYSKNLRVTAELPPGVPRDTVFWWIIRGLQNYPLEVCGFQLPGHARIRLHKLENFHAQPLEEFDLARVSGCGLVFQVTMAAKSSSLEFMEGQMRAYFGGASDPQYLSSGLEDYFLGTYYFNRGMYHLPEAGLTHKDESDSSFSAYRFHDQDPIVFTNGIRLSCRCGERRGDKTFGPTGNPLLTTYTTYTWIYEW